MSEAETEILSITIGTAGHIDHGKTTLVRRLVGGAPSVDRLKDEQSRGMTIDIGYAEFVLMGDKEVGIVDVPGHEKFIRNMVAGAVGVDVVLLVVAADDGVMPQTREHMDILTLLGIENGVVALTKCDLVDEEMVELARDDVESFLAGTFLDGAPIVEVSGETGDGVAELIDVLSGLVAKAETRDHEGLFRLPIQRTFTVPGYGTVVTGIPLDGAVSVGDRVEVLPRGLTSRVRGLQAYHRRVEKAYAGHRTAVNLGDVDYRAVRRGDVLVTPGLVSPSSILATRLRLLPNVSKAMTAGTPIRLHVGTSVVEGRLIPLASRAIQPGEETFAQIRTDHPVVVGPGDRFIIRRPSPATTLGGGVILGTPKARLKARRPATLRALEERVAGLADPLVALEALLRSRRMQPTGPEAAARALLIWPEAAARRLAQLEEAGRAVRPEGQDRWFHPESFDRAKTTVLEVLAKTHARLRLQEWVPLRDLRSASRMTPEAFAAALATLEAEGGVLRNPAGDVRAADHRVELSPDQTRRLEILEGLLRDAPFSPPTAPEYPDLMEGLPDECRALTELLIERGRAVRLTETLVLHAEAVAEARRRIEGHEKARTGLSAAEIRTLLDTSRKYVIPILEYLDAAKFTVRKGDLRILA